MRETNVGTAGVAAENGAAAIAVPLHVERSITTTRSIIGAAERDRKQLNPGSGRADERRGDKSNVWHSGPDGVHACGTFQILRTGRRSLVGKLR